MLVLDQFLHKRPTVNAFTANYLSPKYSYSFFTEFRRGTSLTNKWSYCRRACSPVEAKKGVSEGDSKAAAAEHVLPFRVADAEKAPV